MKATLCVLVFALIAPWAQAQTNLTELLQQGMFEEQANHNLDAAIADYQSLSTQFNKDRQLAATAIFRLGECYREEGQTNQAAVEYRRILNEFPDQKTLATLSQEDLAGIGAAATAATATIGNSAAPATSGNTSAEAALLARQILGIESLTNTLEQARAIVAIFPENSGDLQNWLQASTAQNPGRSNSIQQQVNFILGVQKARLKALQAAAGMQNSSETVQVPTRSNDEDQEIVRIQEMIQNSPDLINAPDDHGHTPLEKAAMDGSLKVAAFLLDHGADVNAGKFSALNLAANAGNRAMVEFLLSRGANINAKAWTGETPLHTAASEGYKAVTEALLARKADPNARNDSGATPLLEAARNGHTQIVQILLNAGADPNIPDKDGRTPLSYAAASGSPETVKMFLAAKADPNAGTLDAPLLCAIDNQDLASAELLLQAGANPNVDGLMHCAQGSYGSRWDGAYSAITRMAPALWLAIQKHQLPMVQLLLEYKANPDNSGITEPPAVIFWALDNTNILQALLNAGANPNITRGDGRTPLSVAAETGSLGAVELLLAAKADPNGVLPYPPLAWAVSHNHPEIVHLLLQAGADPNAHNPPNANGEHGGIIFSALDHTNILEELLVAGADPNGLGINGDSPLANAIFSEDTMAVAILLNHGANPNLGRITPNPNAYPRASWPVYLAADRLNEAAMQLLLDHNANPNVQDGDGKTPLKLVEKVISGDRRINDISPDQQETIAASMADLLRQHGAMEVLPDWTSITVSRPSTKFSNAIFYKGTNDWNQLTLYDLLGVQYGLLSTAVRRTWGREFSFQYNLGEVHNGLQFPDFAHVIIRRPPIHGTNWTELKLDLAHALDSGDCSADVPLKFGDEVEIPETDHILNEKWMGLSTNQLLTLAHCLTRHLQITVNGLTTNITVGPQVKIAPSLYLRYDRGSPPIAVNLAIQTFMLWPVLDDSQLLLSSSDLSRVLVKRRDAATGKIHEWTVDCSNPDRAPYFWLRDGDVIEVPEQQ